MPMPLRLGAARRELLDRGVEVGSIRHTSPLGDWRGGFAPGIHPERADYASFRGLCRSRRQPLGPPGARREAQVKRTTRDTRPVSPPLGGTETR